MKEIETNLPPRVSTQCNAFKKKMVCMEQMEQSEDILGQG